MPRAETVNTKPSFGAAFRSRRCLVPANGWFEWQRTGRGKQPYYLTLADDSPLSFAALWERWSRDSESVESFTIITTAASPELVDIHHRQPAIIDPGQFDDWLDPTLPLPRLLDLVREPHGSPYERRAVSTRVNSVWHDDPDILAPRSELELFWREAEIGVNCQDRRLRDRQTGDRPSQTPDDAGAVRPPPTAPGSPDTRPRPQSRLR